LSIVLSRLVGLGRRSCNADPLMRAPHADRHDAWVVGSLNADADRLAAGRRVGTREHLPLAALVHQSVSDPKLCREDLDSSFFSGRGFATQIS